MYADLDGVLWLGTIGVFGNTGSGGLSRYDGSEFANFTTEHGLVNNTIMCIYRMPDNVMWFGTVGGVSRYDNERFANITTKDGLVHDMVRSIHCDFCGDM